jgi:acetyl esterase/lipase
MPMDIFYPPNRQADKLLPAVIITNSFPRTAPPPLDVYGSRTYDSFQTWGRIFAANGLIAVAYDTLYPNDLEAVVKHIQQNSTELGIDGNRLGLFAESSWVVLASSFAYQEDREYLKVAVFYYGFVLTPENLMRQDHDALCAQFGCFSAELPDIKRLRTDLPVLIVRCGDDTELNTAPVDRFAQIATQQGVPLTLIRFDEGSHAFEWSDTSFGEVKTKGIEIIKQTIKFMKANLFNQ